MDGDPATFNGLAEEALACQKAGIGFDIVPGVSAVSAVPAYAGIPLTSSSSPAVHVISANDRHVDWSASVADSVTVVLLGRARGPRHARSAKLLAAGRAGRQPGGAHRARHDDPPGHPGHHPGRGRQGHEDRGVPGPGRRRLDRGPARAAVVVRDQAAVRLERPGAPHQGAVRLDHLAAGVLRRDRRGRPDDLRRAAAHAPADGARGQGPGHRSLRVDRLHLGQRRQGGAREVRGVRARRPRLRRAQDRRRRWRHRRGAARVGHRARPRAVRREVRQRAARGLAAVRRGARPDQPGLPAARRHRDRHPRRRAAGDGLGGRRRHGLPHRARRSAGRRTSARPSRAGSSTRPSSRRPRRCATSSASPASRTRPP